MTAILVLVALAVIGFLLFPILATLIDWAYRLLGSAAKGLFAVLAVGFLVFMFTSFGSSGIFFGLVLIPVLIVGGIVALIVIAGALVNKSRDNDDFKY